ncbi:BT_3987 domain-containing protein [Autumnicola musiva]|uniref:DUF1735 domain-containing protein n=1 Tax=Autumnicola musiva TaxID=3075589 RepID=A0ABU3D1P2_9FLAO|nr:DUF1735 domain-containing protein [Zunongwangia sp. F117]MDT0675462.1 DUF1735 domain-containing protein [Zunongwangia sp. F117]
MKNIASKILNFIGLIAMFTIGACSSDDTNYDFEGDTTNRIFVNSGTQMVNNYNGFNTSVVSTPVGYISEGVFAKFPVRSTLRTSSDVMVNFEVNNTLVDNYNLENGTNFSTVPEGMVNLEVPSLTINQGNFQSSDSISLSVPSESYSQLTEENYLVPITISSLEDAGNAEISTNLNTVYLMINTLETNVYDGAVEEDMEGEVVEDKSTWTATTDVPVSAGLLENMFNPDVSDYWFISPAQETELIVDLGIEYTDIKAIRFNSYSSNFSLTSIHVSTSNDGETWISQGTAGLSTSSSYQYIKFYAPVTGRYLKLGIEGWSSSSYVIMSTFDIYQ